MSFDKENPEALLLMNAFHRNNVYYLIVGGFAVNRYGYNRATGDLDIYLKDTPENRKNLINALSDMQYGQVDVLLNTPIIAGYCEVLMDDGLYADLMTDIPGLEQKHYDDYFAMATVDFIDEISVRFIHYNHLLENKKATNRPKDQLDIAELNRINNKGEQS